LTFDNALTKYIGDFGLGQIIIFTLASLMWVPNAVLILLLVFSLGSPVTDRQWTCNQADDATCAAVWSSPDPAVSFCSLNPSQWSWTHPRTHMVSEFNLICSESWKSQMANSFFFIGYLIGSGLFGNLADSFGRKKALFGATAASAVFTAACIAATNYWVLVVLRLLTGIGVAGQALGAYILATEMIGPSWRGAAGILSQVRKSQQRRVKATRSTRAW
jgi:MFS family permease